MCVYVCVSVSVSVCVCVHASIIPGNLCFHKKSADGCQIMTLPLCMFYLDMQ